MKVYILTVLDVVMGVFDSKDKATRAYQTLISKEPYSKSKFDDVLVDEYDVE